MDVHSRAQPNGNPQSSFGTDTVFFFSANCATYCTVTLIC